MKRVCLINVAALSGRLLESVPGVSHLKKLLCPPRPLKPTLPAVTCSVQASLTTGVDPEVHGIISNGLYLRESRKVSFYEQSNTLLAKKRFWHSRHLPQRLKVAMLFWQNSLAGAADIVVTPRPKGAFDASCPSACCSQLAGLYERLAEEIGEFDASTYWGPAASAQSSEWITQCALRVWEQERPDLQLVYLPHLKFAAERWGPDDPRMLSELQVADHLVGLLAKAVQADGGEAVVVSEYGVTPVSQAAKPNFLLRHAGLLAVREEDGREHLDLENSRAFAMVDHQIAHVYCHDRSVIPAVRDVFGRAAGVGRVMSGEEIEFSGLGHFRSGDVVLLARPDSWFAYYWWSDPAKAPAFAHAMDMQRKPGQDPCELFFDPQKREVPTDTSLLKGSHGLVDVDSRDHGILAATCDLRAHDRPMATDLPEILKAIIFG